MKIFQYVDVFSDGDGIGNDIKGLQKIFDSLQIENYIYTRIDNSKETHTFSISEKFQDSKENIHILHFGGAGFPLDFFQNLIGKKILRFHNLTPVDFFKKFLSQEFFISLKKNELLSILELETLDKSVDLFLHDSAFNYKSFTNLLEREFVSQNKILPIAIDYSLKEKKSIKEFSLSYIGRWVPNKKIEHLLFTLYYLKKKSPLYKLTLIGKKSSVFEKYNLYIENIITKLDLKENLIIHNDLNDEDVQKIISESKFYVSMSEHEGYGIPILEAISNHTLVVSYFSTAKIELLEKSGVYFYKKDFPYIAELIHEINLDESLYLKLLNAQIQRLKFFENFPFKEKIQTILKELI